MDTKKVLKSFVTNFVNDKFEAATADLKTVITQKTREAAGLVKETALQEKEYPKHSIFLSKDIYDGDRAEELVHFEKELKDAGLTAKKSLEVLGSKEMDVFVFDSEEDQEEATKIADSLGIKYSFYGEKSGLRFSQKKVTEAKEKKMTKAEASKLDMAFHVEKDDDDWCIVGNKSDFCYKSGIEDKAEAKAIAKEMTAKAKAKAK